MKNQDLELEKDEIVEHSKYLVHALLPSLKIIHEEQKNEMVVEARRKGMFFTLCCLAHIGVEFIRGITLAFHHHCFFLVSEARTYTEV